MKIHGLTKYAMLRLCIIIIGFWSPAVLAQTLQIMPVTLGMPHGALSNTLFVTNRANDTQMVQARPFLWRQVGGADVLTPTDALVVSPPMTSIAPGATQVFRVLLRQPAEKTETSYRILIDELPPPLEDVSGVRLTLRLSVPLFALPEQVVKGGTDFSVLVDNNGAVLHAENNGVQHLRIVHPVLQQDGVGKIALSAAEISYVLAGASQDWPLPAGRRFAPGSVLHLTALSDQGPVDATVHVLQR
jgi:fimbrial chaperone protein